MNTRGILTVNLDRLRTQVQTVWIQHAARPHDHYWTIPYSRDFFAGCSAAPIAPTNTIQGLPPKIINPPSREPKRGRPPVTFTATQPPVILTQPLQHGENPYGQLRRVQGQAWPQMMDHQGKHRHLCFSSLFVSPFNKCKDPEQCGARFSKRRQAAPLLPSRLHIDLADSQWAPSTYPEKNWDPLVKFIKQNPTSLQPSSALKRLTPSATWT